MIPLDFLTDTVRLLLFNVLQTMPLWLPLALGFFFWKAWAEYTRTQFLLKQNHILLEIKSPKEVTKSPLAMELFLNALHQTVGESNWYDRYFLGKTRAHFSLELVSIDGQVRFFIWTRPFLKKFIESQLYSQYPTAEVFEVPDYTASIPYAKKDSDWKLFGVEFKLSKPDPYPIKTYVDYETDKDVFEEKKIDPITPMLEFLGAVEKNEQVWFQIIVRANKGKSDPTSAWTRDWQEEGKAIVNEIFQRAKERSGPTPGEEAGGDRRFAVLSEGERTAIKAIERNTSKLGFDCGIRGVYIAKKDSFNPANIAGLFGTVKQYSSLDLNGFSPRQFTAIDYPWQHYIGLFEKRKFSPTFSFQGHRVAHLKWKFFDAYRKRSWFFSPYERKPFVLNTEELATIYHFPGRVAETPTFERIESRKSEPPSNLPT